MTFSEQGEADLRSDLSHSLQHLPIEAGDQGRNNRIMGGYQLAGRVLGPGTFEFDVQTAASGRQTDYFIEGWDALSSELPAKSYACVSSLQFRQPHRRYDASCVRCSIDGRVMNHDGGSIARNMDVEFAHIDAKLDRGGKGR